MSQAKIEALVRAHDPLLESLIGGTPEDRAAIWGQAEQEANDDPAAEEVKGSSTMGIGLIQWTGPRHTQYVQFAQALGRPWQDAETQVRFIGQELNGPYAHAWEQIRTVATTLKSKTETAMGLYEGPAGWQQEIKSYGSTTAGMPRRLQGAQWALAAIQQLKGTKPVTDTSNVANAAPAATPVDQIAAFIKKAEVSAEDVLRAFLVSKGFPGPILDLAFNVINQVDLVAMVEKVDWVSLIGKLLNQNKAAVTAAPKT